MNDDLVKQQTMSWIEGFIIKYNICPFAKRVVTKKEVAIEVFDLQDIEEALQRIISCIINLEKNLEIETTLLVFPTFLKEFDDYLDFVYLAERLLKEQNYDIEYQLATFHPEYCFSGVDKEDVSNYTNRSPYPMIHILRESSIDKAIEFYGNTEKIPEENIATMHKIGLDKIRNFEDKN